jgi:hypothetical protein
MRFIDYPHFNNARQHALKRAYQRWGLAISNIEYSEMSLACKTLPVVAKSEKGNNTVHKVDHRGRQLWAVFNPELGCIVTFLKCGKPEDIRNAHVVNS